jgi:hypothetical protein
VRMRRDEVEATRLRGLDPSRDGTWAERLSLRNRRVSAVEYREILTKSLRTTQGVCKKHSELLHPIVFGLGLDSWLA